eukprot:COSAG01_NODE_645_length_14553_cov_32.925227_1_plen_621_part_00
MMLLLLLLPPSAASGFRQLAESAILLPPAARAARLIGSSGKIINNAAVAPGAPEQIKLSLTASAGEVVVSWISKDAVPQDGSCFTRPQEVWEDGQTGSSPPVPFPYPIKPGCSLADGVVEFVLGVPPPESSGDGDDGDGGVVWVGSRNARNASLLFADHDVDGNDKPTNVSTPRVVHIVRLSRLLPAQHYHYRVRSIGGNWSATFSFRTLPVRAESLSLLITADVGEGGIPPAAISEAQKGMYDLYLHAGDIAYDLEMDHGSFGDKWANEVQAITSRTLFQAWPGNHETDDNHCDFLHYRARFSNQNLTSSSQSRPSHSSRYYSFDVPGLLHVVGIDTDSYAEPDYDTNGNGASGQSFFIEEQYEWLEQDLRSVNRTETPWLVLLGHHPMYCSSSGETLTSNSERITYQASSMVGASNMELARPDKGAGVTDPAPRLSCRTAEQKRSGHIPAWWHERNNIFESTARADGWCYDCSVGSAIIRDGCTTNETRIENIPSCGVGSGNWTGKRYGLEPLLDRFNVDLYFTGHVHMYERSWPVLYSQVEHSYVNPTKPVHVNTGNSGSRSAFENGPPRNFTAFRLTDVGCYTRLKIHNATHLSFEQAHVTNGSVLDSFDMVKMRR